jgi:hypothetical protein
LDTFNLQQPPQPPPGFDIFVLVCFCLLPPILFLSTLLLFIALKKRKSEVKNLTQQIETTQKQGNLKEQEFYSRIQRAEQEIKSEYGLRETELKFRINGLEKELRLAREDTRHLQKQDFIRGLSSINYRNEVEVETKFIYTLVSLLGYKPNDFNMRVPVDVIVGRQSVRGEADWVIYDNRGNGTKNVAFVIEAKASSQLLTREVKEQARSYAFALNAPTYVLTNGKQLQIYRRSIQTDICAVDCKVAELEREWNSISQLLAVKGRYE